MKKALICDKIYKIDTKNTAKTHGEKEMDFEILAVVGPTASGKSALALELAKRYGGEIICCDSMQIYRKMNIGTAKPTQEEMREVPHHLFDLVAPWNNFSCADYIVSARKETEEILGRGKLPVFCGGTGLYLDRFICGGEFEDTETDLDYRDSLQKIADENGNEALHRMLGEIDPVSAENIHPNNIKRVIRALEIYKTSGFTKSELDARSKKSGNRYKALQIGIKYEDRELLYRRIDERVDKMLSEGLLEEVRELEDEGIFKKNLTAAQAIGYKELLGYIRGEKTFEEAVDELKRATRRYAKRQMTWFSSHGDVKWIRADGRAFQEMVEEAEKLIGES